MQREDFGAIPVPLKVEDTIFVSLVRYGNLGLFEKVGEWLESIIVAVAVGKFQVGFIFTRRVAKLDQNV